MISPDQTEVVPYLTSAATIVFVQRWLKTTDVYERFMVAFPGADKWAHWLVAGVSSLIAAEGIHIVWNWTAIAGGQAVIKIPDLSSLLHGLSDWFKVYILQHTIYDLKHQSTFFPPKE